MQSCERPAYQLSFPQHWLLSSSAMSEAEAQGPAMISQNKKAKTWMSMLSWRLSLTDYETVWRVEHENIPALLLSEYMVLK